MNVDGKLFTAYFFISISCLWKFRICGGDKENCGEQSTAKKPYKCFLTIVSLIFKIYKFYAICRKFITPFDISTKNKQKHFICLDAVFKTCKE